MITESETDQSINCDISNSQFDEPVNRFDVSDNSHGKGLQTVLNEGKYIFCP